jgi:hypothetical protein
LLKITSTKDFRNKISKNSKAFWANSSYRSKQAIARAALPATSILETITSSVLYNVYNIKAKQAALGPWTFDLGFEFAGRKILIECQGDYWHSLKERMLRDRQKYTYWQRCLSQEYELHYLYEYEFFGINRIRDRSAAILGIEPVQKDFEFKSLQIKLSSTDEANTFFNQHHYLSRGRGGLKIGAYLEDSLIACASFNSVTRKQSADRLKLPSETILELERFCIHPNYHKKNFASWFLTRACMFVPDNTKCLLAFADIGANHNGTIYKAAGWLLDGITKPGYWYIDNTGHRHHKKTIWDQAKRLCIKESEYAPMAGLVKIRGMPVLRFVKILKP